MNDLSGNEYSLGPHLMLEVHDCPKEKLTDVAFVFDFLDNLPARIGMSKIAPPYVFRYSGALSGGAGVSGVLLGSASHISVHTFPEKNAAFIDIFSRIDYEVEKIKDIIIKTFEAKAHKVELDTRSTEFPQNIRMASMVVEHERADHKRQTEMVPQ